LEAEVAHKKVVEEPSQPSLVDSVSSAVRSMHWLGDSDQAMVDLAVRYAQQIEDAAEQGGDVAFKMVGWLGPHLANTLKSLGGAPAERKALGVDKAVKGRLAELRAAREQQAS
jgi:hypothetical protein